MYKDVTIDLHEYKHTNMRKHIDMEIRVWKYTDI